MKEEVKQELHQLVNDCDNETVLEGAKNLLMSATMQKGSHKKSTEDIDTSLTIENKSSLDEVFGLWKNRNVSLGEIREQQW